VQQYRREMEQSRASRTSLLRRHDLLPSRDAEANNSVPLTWQISFEHIYKTRRSAAELLSLMSFCDRLAIPESLLRVKVDEPSSSADGLLDFEEDVVVLRSFSYVSHTADAQTWEMHRLVQDATLVWLEGHGRLDEVRERFVHHLHTAFPTGQFADWPVCRILFPHAKSAAEQKPVNPSALIQWASVMYHSAWYALEQGDLNDALGMATAAITARSQQLGAEHESTLWSIAMVVSTYRSQGRWKEAEELEVKVMETRVRVLGGEHPDTLTSMANLAATYWNQGRWKEAEDLISEAAEASGRVLGKPHPETLARTSAFHQIGRHDDSQPVKKWWRKLVSKRS